MVHAILRAMDRCEELRKKFIEKDEEWFKQEGFTKKTRGFVFSRIDSKDFHLESVKPDVPLNTEKIGAFIHLKKHPIVSSVDLNSINPRERLEYSIQSHGFMVPSGELEIPPAENFVKILIQNGVRVSEPENLKSGGKRFDLHIASEHIGDFVYKNGNAFALSIVPEHAKKLVNLFFSEPPKELGK